MRNGAEGGTRIADLLACGLGTNSYDTGSMKLLGALVLADIPGKAAAEIG